MLVYQLFAKNVVMFADGIDLFLFLGIFLLVWSILDTSGESEIKFHNLSSPNEVPAGNNII